jgi:hypothetical protein
MVAQETSASAGDVVLDDVIVINARVTRRTELRSYHTCNSRSHFRTTRHSPRESKPILVILTYYPGGKEKERPNRTFSASQDNHEYL